jgi:lipopolysaccharide biosynthesis glycosyltransferase
VRTQTAPNGVTSTISADGRLYCHELPDTLTLGKSDTWLRTLIPDVLPADVETCLYLDTDVLVRADIREVWTDAAAGNIRPAPAHPKFPGSPDTGLVPHLFATPLLWRQTPQDEAHFFMPHFVQAGVMLLNLSRWREAPPDLAAAAKLAAQKGLNLDDEEIALNLCAQRLGMAWRRLPLAWNVSALLAEKSSAYVFARACGYPAAEIDAAIAAPKAVHFCTTLLKPWRSDLPAPFAPYGDEWKDYDKRGQGITRPAKAPADAAIDREE